MLSVVALEEKPQGRVLWPLFLVSVAALYLEILLIRWIAPKFVFLRIPEPWMGQRFYAMFNDIFGRPPIAFYRPQIGGLVEGTLFLASNDAALWDRAAQPELAALLQASPTSFPLVTDGAPPSVTDDWPYVYHRGHTIPCTYLTVSLILLIIAF